MKPTLPRPASLAAQAPESSPEQASTNRCQWQPSAQKIQNPKTIQPDTPSPQMSNFPTPGPPQTPAREIDPLYATAAASSRTPTRSTLQHAPASRRPPPSTHFGSRRAHNTLRRSSDTPAESPTATVGRCGRPIAPPPVVPPTLPRRAHPAGYSSPASRPPPH